MVLLPAFEPQTWLQVMRSESVSNAFLVPTMLSRIVDHLVATRSAPNLPALRALAYGGGKMPLGTIRSEEHTSELQSLMRISYAVFCLKKKSRPKLSTIANTTYIAGHSPMSHAYHAIYYPTI